jgi:hypothetical protein
MYEFAERFMNDSEMFLSTIFLVGVLIAGIICMYQLHKNT